MGDYRINVKFYLMEDDMREIKFRVWDKENKRWTKLPIKYTYVEDINLEECYEWCQYTGFEDKNGKEIYEGDILEMPDDELYFEVNFDKSDLRYCATEFVLRTNYDLSDFIVANDNRKDIINGFVVGNIYENSNFLEE